MSAQSDSVILIVLPSAISDYDIPEVKIYPNPFCDNISIDLSDAIYIETLNIFQNDGKYIQQIGIHELLNHFSILKLEELEIGTYFIEIVSKSKDGIQIKKTFKVIKI